MSHQLNGSETRVGNFPSPLRTLQLTRRPDFSNSSQDFDSLPGATFELSRILRATKFPNILHLGQFFICIYTPANAIGSDSLFHALRYLSDVELLVKLQSIPEDIPRGLSLLPFHPTSTRMRPIRNTHVGVSI